MIQKREHLLEIFNYSFFVTNLILYIPLEKVDFGGAEKCNLADKTYEYLAEKLYL